MKRYLVVGAGFSGAVVARKLVFNEECSVTVIDARPHVAGNCYTRRDDQTGVMVHEYGPHIFNTSSDRAWTYVRAFGEWMPYVNRVKATTERGVFSFPINLHTINQFFGARFTPGEARRFIMSECAEPECAGDDFESEAIRQIGRELYRVFLYGYTKKQWGCEPGELPASILKRLPIRFNYDDNYYDAKYQAIPRDGYAGVITRMLNHPHITVRLSTAYARGQRPAFNHVFYTGPIDAYFRYARGRLGYRTMEFVKMIGQGDMQGVAVMNYADAGAPQTRTHEHKHFAPWEKHDASIGFAEYSRETLEGMDPFYPKRLAPDMQSLAEYQKLVDAEEGVTFLGRLGTYRYINMDQAVVEALETVDRFIANPRK